MGHTILRMGSFRVAFWAAVRRRNHFATERILARYRYPIFTAMAELSAAKPARSTTNLQRKGNGAANRCPPPSVLNETSQSTERGRNTAPRGPNGALR